MKKFLAFLELARFYALEVLLSNITVARDALSPSPKIRSGSFEIETGPLTERQAFVLANLITMTPGTLSLDISIAEQRLRLHTLYIDQADEIRKTVLERYEPKVRNAF